ncbi:MAG: hypothetical protein BGO55_31955 [Sphingobacteriales bacterium 50-39]|nr:hypothetical protein [Sphingobacteriales bacterium]OJW61107.1 MAG: hypothetical protein BGO55_31955 [Sphingobacteriales bacterium 50-39]
MKSRLHTLLVFLLFIHNGPLKAQSPITSFSAGYQSAASSVNSYAARPAAGSGAFGSCSVTSYTYTFSNGTSNQYKLNSFNANGSTYLVAPAASSIVKLRRVNNAQVTGPRNLVYMETTASSATACPSPATLNFKPPYIDTMENLLAAGMLNQGTDNIFTNTGNGDGDQNNVERVDVIFPTGLNTASPSQAGFAILDRGNNYQHDPFRIVAITSLDAQGNPSGFGSVKICVAGNGSNNGSWGHPTTANGNKQFACYVMRKDAGDQYLLASSNVNQEIGGVFYSFADLGITSGQSLYGYALLGPDGIASPTSAQLLDLSNTSVYPTNTTEAAGGGLDLVAVNTVFQTGSYVVLALPPASPAPRPDDPASIPKWRVFPTMTHQGQRLTLQAPHDGSYSLSIYNTAGIGRTISIRVQAGRASITPPSIPGLYWLQLTSDGQPIPGSGQLIVQ